MRDVFNYPINNHHKIGDEEYKKLQRRKRAKYILLALLIGSLSYGGYRYIEKNNQNNTLGYVVDDDGNNLIVDGSINYKALKKYKLITIEDIEGNEHYFIGKYNYLTKSLYDLSSDISFSVEISQIKEVESISDYLLLLDDLKLEYNGNDIYTLEDKIKQLKKD